MEGTERLCNSIYTGPNWTKDYSLLCDAATQFKFAREPNNDDADKYKSFMNYFPSGGST